MSGSRCSVSIYSYVRLVKIAKTELRYFACSAAMSSLAVFVDYTGFTGILIFRQAAGQCRTISICHYHLQFWLQHIAPCAKRLYSVVDAIANSANSTTIEEVQAAIHRLKKIKLRALIT